VTKAAIIIYIPVNLLMSIIFSFHLNGCLMANPFLGLETDKLSMRNIQKNLKNRLGIGIGSGNAGSLQVN